MRARCILAAKCVDAMRENLRRHNNVYTGAMVPNLQSITDVLTMPDETILASLDSPTSKQYLFAQVTPDEIEQIKTAWLGV